MPIYEYECSRCGHCASDMDSISAPRVKKCPQCGRRSFKRLISAAAFHLKGGGWYATDFKDKPAAKDREIANKDGKSGDGDGGKDDRAKNDDGAKSSGDKSGGDGGKSGGDGGKSSGSGEKDSTAKADSKTAKSKN